MFRTSLNLALFLTEPTVRTLRLLSCYQTVDISRLVSPALSFASCDQAKAKQSVQAANFVQIHCSRSGDPWVDRPRVMFAKSTEARMQEPRPPYRLFADPTRDRRGNVRDCAERTRDERADMAISTRMTLAV